MIVADTGAVLALIDAEDRHHRVLLDLWESRQDEWVLPWAILPEVDYLLREHVTAEAAGLFLADVAAESFVVEYGQPSDIRRAVQLDRKYRALELGLVDGVVAAVAERLHARAIATLDLRDFGALALKGSPQLYPRDL